MLSLINNMSQYYAKHLYINLTNSKNYNIYNEKNVP